MNHSYCKQSHLDKKKVNHQNNVYIKYMSNDRQCPMELWYNEFSIVTGLQRIFNS